MKELSKILKSETGKKVLGVLLGLGVAGLFKMSCDNRSCLVYKGPEFKDDNKTVKVNNKCYGVNEVVIDCNDSNPTKIEI